MRTDTVKCTIWASWKYINLMNKTTSGQYLICSPITWRAIKIGCCGSKPPEPGQRAGNKSWALAPPSPVWCMCRQCRKQPLQESQDEMEDDEDWVRIGLLLVVALTSPYSCIRPANKLNVLSSTSFWQFVFSCQLKSWYWCGLQIFVYLIYLLYCSQKYYM